MGAGKSKKGELSVFPRSMVGLTPCFRMLPKDKKKGEEEAWDAGKPRNPELYTLKDQVKNWCRVRGSGFGVQGSGFGVRGSGFRM